MANTKEIEQYANSLENCASKFFMLHARVDKSQAGVRGVHETMLNFISFANTCEDFLERYVSSSKNEAITPDVVNSLIQVSGLFDLLLLFTRLSDSETVLFSNDFVDKRPLPDGYKLSNYLQKLPLFSQFLSIIKDKAIQNGVVRPCLIAYLNERIVSNQKLIDSFPTSDGAKAAEKENPVLAEVLQDLSVKHSPAIGLSTK